MLAAIGRTMLNFPNRNKLFLTALQMQCNKQTYCSTGSGFEFDEKEDDSSTRKQERGLNRVQLIGRVGKDPMEIGSEFWGYMFSLATNEGYKNKSGEFVNKTCWHRIVVFRTGLRDGIVPYISQGDRLLVEGKINYDKTSEDMERTSIMADNIMILQKKRSDEMAQAKRTFHDPRGDE